MLLCSVHWVRGAISNHSSVHVSWVIIYFWEKKNLNSKLSKLSEMFSETIFVHLLNSLSFLLSLSLSLTHTHTYTYCCLFTWELQTKDKASVKWDLAATWAELAGTLSDIIWKQRLFCMNKRVIKGAGGGQGAVWCLGHFQCVCACVCVRETEKEFVCVYMPRSAWFLSVCETFDTR